MLNSDLNNANILIVDDQEANIAILTGFLALQGFKNLKSTTDPRDIIDLLTNFKPDIILLDLSMPYMTGFEVMEQLKLHIPQDTYLPILVLTADISTQSKQKALAVGANDFLSKPFDLIEVGLRIKNLLFTGYIQQQLKNKNQILEDKVQERTFELERMNRELLVALKKTETSDRLKTAFIQNISHEIRTPLNGIMGFGSLLAEMDTTDEERQSYVDVLQSSSNRLMKTVTDYMDISLIMSDNLDVHNKHFDVIKQLNKIKDKYQTVFDLKQISFRLYVPENQEVFMLYSDQELFHKIFSHLLNNAIKFTREGTITFGYTIQSNTVEFFVKDTGIGIEKKAQKLIFESFIQENFSNTREHEGSGLGLTIATKMIELTGGSIRLQSVKGEGSIFSFNIPNNIKQEDLIINDTDYFDEAMMNLMRGLKILIVEDDIVSAVYYEEIIKKNFKNVILVTTGEDALIACRSNPDIFLILLDIRLPKMDGFEVIKQLRQFNKEVIIVVQTAYALKGDYEVALASGSNEFISKPVNEMVLFETMKKYLKQKLISDAKTE
jgi:two-component system, sensor histidine kinase and response regulator